MLSSTDCMIKKRQKTVKNNRKITLYLRHNNQSPGKGTYRF